MLNTAQRDRGQEAHLPSIQPHLAAFSVCYTPRPGSALAAFGRSWFGRANDGTTLRAFSSFGIAAKPDHHFGLHAPFFSPLRLRDDARIEDVRSRLMSFAAHRKPIDTGPLTLMRAGRSLALRPAEPRPELNWLALQCLNAFDGFAAMSETAGEEHPHLSPYQRLLLKSFGQPNVMSEYRFSIRLTGPLDTNQLERVACALRPLLAGICADGIRVDGLSLIGTTRELGTGQEPDTRTRHLGRYALAG